MSKENNDKKSNKDSKNLFEIMDGIIDQLNKTKRLFIIMILTVMIIPPMVFVITFELLGPPGPPSSASSLNSTSPSPSPPSSKMEMMTHHKSEHREGLLGFNPLFTIVKNIPLIIGIVWLGIGIRQWILLSKWSRKYQRYKELQKKIDEKFDNDIDLNGNNMSDIDKQKDKDDNDIQNNQN
jgi:hypothetical protein